jgi:hydroxymethylpyrimidine/phosphomethylpyrimidine kinase
LSHSAALISIAGADPGQGAGLQMDQQVCAALGVTFLPVVAVYTDQDADGLRAITPRLAVDVAADLRTALQQADSVQQTIALKTGALGDAAIVAAIAEVLRAQSNLLLVVDPVRRASRNHEPGLRLLTDEGWQAAVRCLLPLATLATPNADEFGAGADFAQCPAVLRKGGHQNDGTVVEDQLLRSGLEPLAFRAEFLAGATEIHGTGCALSAAISCYLAQGLPLAAAIAQAHGQMHSWLAAAVGRGSTQLW